MKKTENPFTAWWNNNLLIGAFSMLVILLATELFFALPSKWLHTPSEPRKDIVHEAKSKTNLALDESPVFCTKEYIPVCGDDGKTYANKCMAGVAKVTISHEGTCADMLPTQQSGSSVSVDTVMPDPETISSSSVETLESDIDFSDTKKYHNYKNSSIGYSMAFPSYSYYQGYGARDGAQHTIAVGLSSTGITSFEMADVRVYYYQKSAPKDIGSGMVRVATQSGVLLIETSLASDPKIQKIVDTIQMSAR